MNSNQEDVSLPGESQTRAKLERFLANISRYKPVVFCVKCGSTRIDQNSFYELRCYDCDNKICWNAYHFAISRYEDSSDIVSLLRRLEALNGFNEWHRKIDAALQEFMRLLIHDSIAPSQDLDNHRLKVELAWKRCKSDMDALIQNERLRLKPGHSDGT